MLFALLYFGAKGFSVQELLSAWAAKEDGRYNTVVAFLKDLRADSVRFIWESLMGKEDK